MDNFRVSFVEKGNDGRFAELRIGGGLGKQKNRCQQQDRHKCRRPEFLFWEPFAKFVR